MVVPIVLAANDDYAPMLGVTIQSVLANANITDLYHFYIFQIDELSLYNFCHLQLQI